MRWVAAFLVLALAGCGGSGRSGGAKQREQKRGKCVPAPRGYELCGQPSDAMTSPPSTIIRGDTVVVKPIERHGYWRRLFVSPDRETLLAQWSGECEVPTAYLIRASGGKPRPVVDVQYESIALGWSQDGRARVLLPQGACGAGQRRPGVYLVSVAGQLTFVRAVKRRPGGA